MPDNEEVYSNIREILGRFIGQKLLDITQHDEEEFAETKQSYVCLMFEKGDTITFPIGEEGFDHTMDAEEDAENA